MNAGLRASLALSLLLFANSALAENRSIDGTGNNLNDPTRGAANTPFIRINYKPEYVDGRSVMVTEPTRPNARTISNTVSAQSTSRPSARHLSNYIWAWGQFLTHDTDLSTSSAGSAVNGSASIAVGQADPLGPNPIPFTRANFVLQPNVLATGTRIPVNEVTDYIDASAVYGSDAARATALRTNNGLGAKLLTDANNLLPRNTAGLPNENEGPVPNDQLFLAGDIRSNENSLLTSLHTIFAREHNRLVDRIAIQQPQLNDEAQYQLARKLVGAEMQTITYHEFLPALLGTGSTVPKAEQFIYNSQQQPTITTAHSVAAFRYGHSAVTSQLNLVEDNGSRVGNLAVRDVFFNPSLIGNNPQLVDELLQGAATQTSEEIDNLVVDDLRNFLFGPPGAGGLDLAALNIQRGRDVGLPNYRTLRTEYSRGSAIPSTFSQITSDPQLAQVLSTLYGGNINQVDAWVGGLAEDHLAGSSVGPLFQGVIEGQFQRLRDGDRLFYRGAAAGLYSGNALNPDIAAIVDLDHLTLGNVILANTSISHVQKNVFFVPTPGDFNGDGLVDAADYITWRRALGTDNIWVDGDGNGTVGPEDYDVWRAHFNATSAVAGGTSEFIAQVPEPPTLMLLLLAQSFLHFSRRALKVGRRSKRAIAYRSQAV
jgi:peroxidase